MNVGNCSACGSMTSSGSHKYCRTCSTAKNECMHCGASLLIKGASPDTKSSFIVSVNTDYYLTGPQPQGAAAVKAHLTQAFASFKSDLSAWISTEGVTDLTIANEMPNLCILVIECSTVTSEKLKAMPGVDMVAVNSVVHAI
jgi:hypothetical protein